MIKNLIIAALAAACAWNALEIQTTKDNLAAFDTLTRKEIKWAIDADRGHDARIGRLEKALNVTDH